MLEYIPYDEILEKIDVKKGDILDVSSDLEKVILYCKRYHSSFSPDTLIDSIQDKVGNLGTIMIRAWNWDFCHGTPFDIRKTPSRVGALGNVALRRKDFKRTRHPLYSYMVWGKNQEEICEMNDLSAFGADSMFGYLYKNHGKQLMFGSTMFNSFTFVHFVEEQTGIKYRYLKKFEGEYIDYEGNKSIQQYYMNVRDLNLDIKMNSEKFAEDFYEQGALNTWNFDGLSVSLVDLQKTYPIVEKDILTNRSRKICSYIGQ